MENPKRQAALRAVDRFCLSNGFPVPSLEERETMQGGKPVVAFIGKAPDGREFGIGYEA